MSFQLYLLCSHQIVLSLEFASLISQVLSKHMEAKDFPEAGTEDQDMDWAKGLVRSIVNVYASNSNDLTIQYRGSVAVK